MCHMCKCLTVIYRGLATLYYDINVRPILFGRPIAHVWWRLFYVLAPPDVKTCVRHCEYPGRPPYGFL